VLATYFGWSLLSSLRQWLGIGSVAAPAAHATCATLEAAPPLKAGTPLKADDPRVNVRIPPATRAWLN
jgi:hypothetical protein